MIDIHAHILPEVDDGAGSLEESIEMARIAFEDGITHMAATPHMYNGLSHNPDPAEVVARVSALQEAIGESLVLMPGNEVHIAHDLADKLRSGKLTPLNGKNHVLVELPSANVPPGLERVLYDMQVLGATPVLVHPERNSQIQDQPSVVAGLIAKGVRVQVTAMSITGEFGAPARKCVEELLRHNCVHVIATDTHRVRRRPPVLSLGRDAAAGIVGLEAARKMVEDHPRAIIEGRAFEPGPPIPFDSNARPSLLSRLFRH